MGQLASRTYRASWVAGPAGGAPPVRKSNDTFLIFISISEPLENEIEKRLRTEIRELEERLSEAMAALQRLQAEHVLFQERCRSEVTPYTDLEAMEELIWEEGCNVREYERACVAPLERALEEKRRALKLFER